MGESFGYKEKIHAKLSDLSLACTQKAHKLQNLRKITDLLSQNSRNKGEIWWTPGENLKNLWKMVCTFTPIDFMAVQSEFVKIFHFWASHTIYIYIVYDCW